ncbi:MAG: T9SS type A sorting domain-containing protein [Bacteroidales bacterium]|nr:T9SS type A sorting domain-containing protein [Bacteroidales bacterium]
MKKHLIFTLLILFFSLKCFSQVFQLANPGFEIWDGNNTDDEPTYWNGFPSSACDLTGVYAVGCNAATITRHGKSTDVRPGSSGNFSCRIFATQITILGNTIIANGALTTGQIRVGSTTASSYQNYNITRTGQQNFRREFNAKPDSISFWARFVCPSTSQEAKMVATIHDNYDYREPEGSDPNAASHVVGNAIHFFTRGNQNWKKYTVPFNYSYPATNPAYILVTFTTNKDAGLGSANDMLFIDDIEMIYNPRLSQLQVNGNNIQNFDPDSLSYYVSVPCQSLPIVTATAASPNATVQVTQAIAGSNTATVNVTAGNITRQYNIYFIHQAITQINADICVGETYTDNWFSLPPQPVPGSFTHTYTSYSSPECDSLYVLSLNVHPSYIADTFNVMICENSAYDFYGTLLADPGVYDTIVPSTYGCDSLVTLNLSVGSFYLLTFNATICQGDSYTLNGFNQSEAGSDTLSFVAVNGCDSLVVLNLSLNPIHFTYIYDTVFQGETYAGNGFLISNTDILGTVKDTLWLTNSFGCDSLVYLHLSIISNDSETNDDNNFKFIIFPNPSANSLNIKIESSTFAVYLVQFFDSFGKMRISEEMFNNDGIIDLKDLSSGFYIVRVLSSANVARYARLVKF